MARRVLLLVALLSAIAVERAEACSCADLDPRDRLEAGEAAVIGRVLSRTPETTTPPFEPSSYVVRVERALNARLGREVVVRGDSSSCGFDWRTGQRVAAFLQRTREGWATNLCSLARPSELERALKPYPRPLGRGRVALLAGGSFGDARLLALDRRGRILGYGFGQGTVRRISICPGSRAAAELVDRGRSRSLVAVRSLATLQLLSTAEVPRSMTELSCADAAGTSVYAAGILYSGRPVRGRASVFRVSGSGRTTLVRRPAEQLALGPGAAYAWSGGRVLAISLADGSERTLLQMGLPELITPSPYGALVAIRGFDDRLRLVDLEGGAVASRRLGPAWVLSWLAPDRLLARVGGTAVIYDDELMRQRRYGFYRAVGQAYLDGALFGTDRYRLVRLELESGRKRTAAQLPDRGIADLVGVPDGPELQAPRRAPTSFAAGRIATCAG